VRHATTRRFSLKSQASARIAVNPNALWRAAAKIAARAGSG